MLDMANLSKITDKTFTSISLSKAKSKYSLLEYSRIVVNSTPKVSEIGKVSIIEPSGF